MKSWPVMVLAVLCANAYAQEADRIFGQVMPSVVTIVTEDENGQYTGSGSGIMAARERVVTNCHVVAEAEAVRVQHGGRSWAAVWSLQDPHRDLCALDVKGLIAPIVRVRGSETLAVGEQVYAVGNPLGFGLAVSAGNIAALPAYGGEARMVVTSAQISPGSSGGGLFDVEGRLVGITMATLSVGQSLNIALPAEAVPQLLARGKAVAVATPLLPSEPRWADELAELQQKQAFPEMEELARRFVAAHPGHPEALATLCAALILQDRLAEAETACNEAIGIARYGFMPLVRRSWLLLHLGRLEEAERDARTVVQRHPMNGPGYEVLAAVLKAKKAHAEAVDVARRLTQLYPAHPSSWSGLGSAYHDAQRFDEAIAAHQFALKLDPQDPLARQNLPALLAYRGRMDEARTTLETSSAPVKGGTDVWTKVGDEALAALRMVDAEQAYRKALADEPDKVEAIAGLTIVYINTNRLDQAEKLVGDALKRNLDHALLQIALARIYMKRGRVSEATQAFERAVTDPRVSIDIWRELARAYDKAGSFVNAAEAYREVTSSADATAADWVALCTAQIQASAAPAQAEQSCTKALALDDKSEGALIGLAKIHGDRGNQQKALEYAQRAIEVNPGSYAAMSNAGYGLLMLGRHKEAIEMLESAIRLDPGQANPWINLGNAYLRTNQAGKAIWALERALELAPKALDARIYLVQAYLASQQPQRALREVEKMKQQAPDSGRVLYISILVNLASGDRSSALADYEKLKQVSAPMATDLYRRQQQANLPAHMQLPE